METQNLWPDFALEITKSPKAILKEQAGFFMAKTNNVLSAEVDTLQGNGQIIHQFYIIAPALNNYRYKIFSVKHKIVDYYPLSVEWDEDPSWKNKTEAKDEESFIGLLRETFNKPDTIRIVSSLLSQSLAE